MHPVASATFDIAADPVPLNKWDDGSIRVSGTRLHYYLFLHFYRSGDGPEDLLEAFPFLDLGTIHVLIGYYLRHQKELDGYLAEVDREIEEIRKWWDERYPPDPGLKDRLLARMAERSAGASDRP
ncbi:MAG: DUF433 domain-containing protein [Tepidiformaceae bacterium]